MRPVAIEEMKIPTFADAKDFDPNDPFDATAEQVRKVVITALLDSGVMINQANAEAVLYGLLVGVCGFGIACTKPEGHRDLIATIQAYTPYAVNISRNIVGLDELRDT